MPIYSDSAILNVLFSPLAVVAHYGPRAVFVSDVARPSTPFEVWVTEPAHADILILHRGEYKLGIIASTTNSRYDYVVGNVETRLTPLTANNNLTKPTSMASRLLVKYRTLLPVMEEWVRDCLWDKFHLHQDIVNLLITGTCLSEPAIKLTADDIMALAAFPPYLDMVRRVCAAIMAFYGYEFSASSLKYKVPCSQRHKPILTQDMQPCPYIAQVMVSLQAMNLTPELTAVQSLVATASHP